MKELQKQLTIALENKKVFVTQTSDDTKAECDIGGRKFTFTKPENIALEDYKPFELAEILAKAMIEKRRENKITHEKLSYFKIILVEICHGIFYEGNVEIDYHQEFETWMDEQAI